MLERPTSVPSLTTSIETHEEKIFVIVGFHKPDEKWIPFEIFIEIGHTDPCMKSECEAIARLVSWGLRHMLPVSEVIDQLKGIQCVPQWNNGDHVLSPADGVAQVLEKLTKMELSFPEQKGE